VGLKLSGTHQLLVYVDGANLLGDSIYAIKKNAGTLVDITKEVGPEVKAEKTKYMLISSRQNTGQNRDKKTANRSFGNVAHLKYLGMRVTTENCIQEEIKGRLNSGNACYHSVQYLLFFRLISKNVKMRTYKAIFCL
jgi:hypothetical protein